MPEYGPDKRLTDQNRTHEPPALPKPLSQPEISDHYKADVTQQNFSFPSGNLLNRAFDEVAVRLFTPGTILLEQNSAVEYIYRMEQGMVKYSYAYRDKDTDDEIDTILSFSSDRGTVLDIHSALAGMTFCTIELMTKGYFRRLPAREFRRLVHKDIDVSWHLHQVSSIQLSNHLNKIAVFRCNSSQFNFEMLLCEFIRGMNLSPDKNGYTFKLPLKYCEIAQLLSISQGHLSRLMKKMESQGLLTRNKHTISVPDVNRFSINNA